MLSDRGANKNKELPLSHRISHYRVPDKRKAHIVMTKYIHKNWKANNVDPDGTQVASSGASPGLQRFWPTGLKGISTRLHKCNFF